MQWIEIDSPITFDTADFDCASQKKKPTKKQNEKKKKKSNDYNVVVQQVDLDHFEKMISQSC